MTNTPRKALRPAKEKAGVAAMLKDLHKAGLKTWRIETRQRSGVPDVVACDPEGKLVWIECKRFKSRKGGTLTFEKLRPAQIAFAKQCIDYDVPHFVIVVGHSTTWPICSNLMKPTILADYAKGKFCFETAKE